MDSGSFISRTPDSPSRDMPGNVAFAWSLFLSMGIVGWGLYDLYEKTKSSEKRFEEIEEHLHSVDSEHVVQTLTARELEERIREKKDYDESEEIQEDTYQAWKGVAEMKDVILSVLIWREKNSTVRKNQDWVEWDGTHDSSCVVRDFYLGNGSPDFSWKRLDVEGVFHGIASETMVNGWDSVIRMVIRVSWPSTVNLEEEMSMVCNRYLKVAIEESTIHWTKSLLPSEEAL